MPHGIFLLLLGLFSGVAAHADTVDPLDSIHWPTMHRALLNNEPVVFDARVKVHVPEEAEDSLHLPVLVDATAIKDIEQILIMADFNPIPAVMRITPGTASARVALRLKVQQATPVRAAVLTQGTWHVGGKWVDAAGGGCTVPSHASASPEWELDLNRVRAKLWAHADHHRLLFDILHPMDTGLAPRIPAFYIERIDVRDDQGVLLTQLAPREPISENPLFALDLPKDIALPLHIEGVDNNGNDFAVVLDGS